MRNTAILLSRRLLFVTDRDCHRQPHPVKMQTCKSKYQWIHLQYKVQYSLRRREQKYFNSQRIGNFAVILCILGMYLSTKFQHDCLNMNLIYNNKHTQVNGRAHPASTLIDIRGINRQLKNVGRGKNSLPLGRSTVLPNTKS